LEPGCPNLTQGSRCLVHELAHEKQRRARDDVTGRRADTPEWRRARAIAKHRDCNACQVCGATERLEVHHRNGVRGDDRLGNLVTLCADCHRVADRLLGKVR
jgi:5-methylcytosine-specific restriction endonuclease McrA